MRNSFFKLSKTAVLSLVFLTNNVIADVAEHYRNLSLKELNNLVSQNNPDAQVELGNRYYDGKKGVVKDEQKAFALYQKAVKQNSVRAQNNIGWLYEQKGDYSNAIKWYNDAIQNPSNASTSAKMRAYNNLANLYIEGYGVAKDLDKALELYLQSEKYEPNAVAELDIGWIYEQKKDYAKAKLWYETATRNASEKDKSSKVIAYNNLANFYENGVGVTKNLDKALELYIMAENLSPNVRSELGIAWIYREKQDYQNAVLWYEKTINNPSSSKKDNRNKAKAYHQLAGLYRNGFGVSSHLDKALELYLKADQLYTANDTKTAIAEIFEQKGDPRKAAEWREKVK